MAGRKPQATTLKLLKGVAKDRINQDEPKPDIGIPDMPKWLKGKTAIAEWKRLSEMLDRLGVLTEADGNSLAMYCYIVEQIACITEQIAENGYVAFDIKINQDTGEEIMINPKSNPLALRLENYIRELRSYSALFGLDPSNRSKIMVKPDGKKTSKTKNYYD